MIISIEFSWRHRISTFWILRLTFRIGLHSSWVIPHFMSKMVKIKLFWRKVRYNVRIINNPKSVRYHTCKMVGQVSISNPWLTKIINPTHHTNILMNLYSCQNGQSSAQTMPCDHNLCTFVGGFELGDLTSDNRRHTFIRIIKSLVDVTASAIRIPYLEGVKIVDPVYDVRTTSETHND